MTVVILTLHRLRGSNSSIRMTPKSEVKLRFIPISFCHYHHLWRRSSILHLLKDDFIIFLLIINNTKSFCLLLFLFSFRPLVTVSFFLSFHLLISFVLSHSDLYLLNLSFDPPRPPLSAWCSDFKDWSLSFFSLTFVIFPFLPLYSLLCSETVVMLAALKMQLMLWLSKGKSHHIDDFWLFTL